jgi:3-phenylpropionate/cinnamic acid dioxygenase small subunit
MEMDGQQRHEIYQQCVDFLNHEADLLDRRKFNDWFDLLTDDITYKVPVRVTRELNAETEFSASASHMDEDRGSLEMRIKRINTEYHWAEDPASRTRHFVTNFKMDSINESGTEVKMRTNLLLYRNKFDSPSSDLLSSERFDILRQVNSYWKLAKRIVYLDHTTIPTNNMAIFF